jgi:UDP-N-acetyl-D-mannosaminuronic acid dehydrogenase
LPAKISIIGLGYIGLPTAAMFASKSVEVFGVDVNKYVVETINSGKIHIVEPGLEDLVRKCVADGTLRAGLEVEPSDAFIIAVPTPILADSKDPDLSYVEKAVQSIAPVLKRGNLIIIESTSPVGTTRAMRDMLAKLRPDLVFPSSGAQDADINMAYCPERVLPGKIIEELETNDRVIGGMTQSCTERAIALYSIFVKGTCIRCSSSNTAEMVKLTENSYRDVNIAFANELSILCDKLAIDVWELISLANRHPRVNILRPGPGVGGHCIAVDPWFIVSQNPDEARLIRTARMVNDSKVQWVIDKVLNAIEESKRSTTGKITVAFYGLSFKPDIDDLRHSPALSIVEHLNDILTDHVIQVVEPFVTQLPETISNAELVDLTQAASADLHVMLVDHSQFKDHALPLGKLVDTRGVWSQS